MSVSTNAILFYGYCWEEDVLLLGDDGPDADWPERILRKRGEVNPWDSYPYGEDDRMSRSEWRKLQEAWVKEHREVIDAWNAKEKAVRQEFGNVDLHWHGSDGCSMPYLSVEESCLTARRGYPKEFCPELLYLHDLRAWDAALNCWLAEFAVEKPHDRPRWWLVSYWG